MCVWRMCLCVRGHISVLAPPHKGHRTTSPASCDPRKNVSAGGGKGKRGSSNSHFVCVTFDQSDCFAPNFG